MAARRQTEEGGRLRTANGVIAVAVGAAPNCGNSFTVGTPVLLATGKAVPISTLKAGDTVLAADTRTGKNQPETVTAVMVHHDTDLYDLTVKTAGGTEVIYTTSNHLFWDHYLHQWRPAAKLKKGEHLKTANGTTAVADGGITPKVRDGWMWDLTVPGNNDHDFYVVADTRTGIAMVPAYAALLVHNDSPVGTVFRSGPYRFQIYSNDHGPCRVAPGNRTPGRPQNGA